jgi:hypothetical protein
VAVQHLAGLPNDVKSAWVRVGDIYRQVRDNLVRSLMTELADLADLPTARLHSEIALADDLEGIYRF